MWQSPILWAFIFLGAIFAFVIGTTMADPSGPGGQTIADFSIDDIDDETVTNADLDGRTTLIYFGFTYCPDICPTTLRKIGDALNDLGDDADNIQVWFVSVDLQRDSEEVLAEYVELIDPRLRAFRPTPEQLDHLRDLFSIVAERVTPAGADDDYYLINHTASTMLINNRGQLVERIPQTATSKDFLLRLRALL